MRKKKHVRRRILSFELNFELSFKHWYCCRPTKVYYFHCMDAMTLRPGSMNRKVKNLKLEKNETRVLVEWLSGLLLSFRSADVKIQSHQEHNYLSKIWVVLATQLYLYRLLIPCLLRQVRTRNDDGSKKKDIYMCTHHSATYFFSSF